MAVNEIKYKIPDEAQALTEPEKKLLDQIRKNYKEEEFSTRLAYMYIRGYVSRGDKAWEELSKRIPNYIEYSEKMKFSELLITKIPNELERQNEAPFWLFGRDKWGHPVVYNPICDYNFSAISKSKEIHPFLICKRMLKLFEVNKKWSEKRGLMQYQCLWIVDMKGIGLVKATYHQAAMKMAMQILEKYFPEFVFKMVVINTGWTFKKLWKLFEGYIDKDTVKKTFVKGNNYLDTLLQFIDREEIWDRYGGTAKCQPELGKHISPNDEFE